MILNRREVYLDKKIVKFFNFVKEKRFNRFVPYGVYNFINNKLVRWSSWSWHLLNTQNVPSSILGRIITFFW